MMMIIKNDIINNGKDKSNGNTMPVIMIKQDSFIVFFNYIDYSCYISLVDVDGNLLIPDEFEDANWF